MTFKIKENKLVKLKRKTWYYETSDTNKRRKNGYPAGGFLSKGESLLICQIESKKTQNETILKVKSLHHKKNIIYMILDGYDEDYFFDFICLQ